MRHAWETEMCTGFWWQEPEGRRPWVNRRHRWEDNIKMVLNRLGGCELDLSGFA